MYQWVDIDLDKRQVFVRGRRLHHGGVGAVAVLVGAVLAVHDLRDFPWYPAKKGKFPWSPKT